MALKWDELLVQEKSFCNQVTHNFAIFIYSVCYILVLVQHPYTFKDLIPVQLPKLRIRFLVENWLPKIVVSHYIESLFYSHCTRDRFVYQLSDKNTQQID